MNIRFSRCCAWTVALSVCFPGICALLGNESHVSHSSSTVRSNSLVNDGLRPVRSHWKSRFRIGVQNEPEVADNDYSMGEFPDDLFTNKQRQHGAVVLHAFLGFYCFVLIAFVCDDYLLPSLARICTRMNISTDIAGATFLAMASSFPEMFVNLIGTFLTKSDLGVGTVVGSAVFDTFATPACGALTALHAIPLEWRILSRDCIVYVISVGTLVVIMWDGLIAWYEATVLLALFFIYLVLLFGGKWALRSCSSEGNGSTVMLVSVIKSSSPVVMYRPRFRNGLDYLENGITIVPEHQQNGHHNPEIASQSGRSEEAEETESPFVWPTEKHVLSKCWFLLTWPLKFLLFVTVPDTRRERFQNWYPLTFVMCVIWIAIASYLVSWMMTVVGVTIGIPDSVMGITFLAAGGNVPELASIVILARQGDGNMAMSNTLGANILDILLCLGLPWLVKCLLTGKDVEIMSGALSYSVLSLVICIIILFMVIASFKFKLNKKVGIICLLLYLIFLVLDILFELKVFNIDS